MPLINAQPFVSILQYYRLLWILGRFGGHKTSLAYKIAEPYLSNGYRLISNNRSVWLDDMSKLSLDEDGKLKAVVILDEGGLEFKVNRQVEQISAYARKMDAIYIIPSYFPPARQAQVITCQPLFSLLATGIPLIIYKWRVRLGGFQDGGYFGWFYPREIYGIYSSLDPGDKARGIVSFISDKTQEYRNRFYSGEQLPTLGDYEETGADTLNDSTQALSDAFEGLETLLKRGGRKNRGI